MAAPGPAQGQGDEDQKLPQTTVLNSDVDTDGAGVVDESHPILLEK
jgi:hypothetical protein